MHSRPLLDAHIHTLLLVAVFSGSASAMLEVFMRDNIILELFSSCMFILQGSWFYQVILTSKRSDCYIVSLNVSSFLSFQIGFVLYPLSGPEWDMDQHDNVMFVTMCFCWHLAVALLLVACIYSTVWW